MKVSPVTKSKYAEMRGCAASAVTRAIAEGRITTIVVEGREMIDPTVADIQWARNTRARADSSGATDAAERQPVIAANEVGSVASYEEARRRRETAEASIAEMKQAEMEGVLIRADAVRSAWAAKITGARDALLQIPSRLAPQLAAESDLVAVTGLLEAELRQALAELSTEAAS